MDIYNAGMIIFLLIIITGIIKGLGSNRTVVIFRDYDDLGLTFLVPVSFFLVLYLFTVLKGDQTIGVYVAGSVAFVVFSKLAIDTYLDNKRSLGKTILALLTKLPLGVIWILNLIQVLNPSGKGAQRSRNRGEALVILTFLTPIIGMLVVDRSGSFFNPKSWITGRRVGNTVRDSL